MIPKHFIKHSLVVSLCLLASTVLAGCISQSSPTPVPDSQLEQPLTEETQDENLPNQVTVNAGAPLNCDLLAEPMTIDGVIAIYSCAAPGAYLSSIDLNSLTAQYFTTNSQGTTVTYGPVEMPILVEAEQE